MNTAALNYLADQNMKHGLFNLHEGYYLIEEIETRPIRYSDCTVYEDYAIKFKYKKSWDDEFFAAPNNTNLRLKPLTNRFSVGPMNESILNRTIHVKVIVIMYDVDYGKPTYCVNWDIIK